ncbi:sensor histidine kinase [Catellatospora bangladeshensis]|uniref:Signal transduction histidine kinase n=1 Tax=Catellatospora bangladeshensis TaxID=310355 RepID=A0A8J3JIY7_9ACTN|nr:hypothetical protein [Catellatospora bangladeshensis]GIF81563.1 hypothetical protein Cba03nite_29120 [Catellatospora bangladeshensis]
MRINASLGWRDPLFLAARPWPERVHRFTAMLLVAQRASYILPAAAGVFAHATPYVDRHVNVLLLGAALVWNIVLVLAVRRQGWFAPWTVAGDVVMTCVLVLAVSANVPLADRVVSAVNWSSPVMLATGALLGATVPGRHLAPALVPAGVAYLVAHAEDLGVERHWAVDFATRLNSYVWFAVILLFIVGYLRGQAARLEDLNRQRLQAQTERARYAERMTQFRRLHDTVLTTLTAIARGGLDHRAEQVRRRCAVDADYVRLMLADESSGGTLADRLAEVAAAAADLGLRIRVWADQISVELPDEVVAAMSEACRAALNNVALHAGVRDARVTVVEDGGVVTVRVVDRGAGFDPASRPGFGLRSSVRDRMREVGGAAEVFSVPGDGTCVDLIWPARSAQQAVLTDPAG